MKAIMFLLLFVFFSLFLLEPEGRTKLLYLAATTMSLLVVWMMI